MLLCLGTIKFAAHAAAQQNVFANISSPSRYFFINFPLIKPRCGIISAHSKKKSTLRLFHFFMTFFLINVILTLS